MGDKGQQHPKTGTQEHTKGGSSYKNILQEKNKDTTPTEPAGSTPSPYIVEQLNDTPELSIYISQIDEHCNTYESQASICPFNCFWPKPMKLFHWILTNWIMDCEIHPFSEVFFIVEFSTSSQRNYTPRWRDRAWLWGSMGLFITSWFPEFDANTMFVSRMSVLVWLYNLHLYFWNDCVLKGIGNIIGLYIKTDTQCLKERIYIFTRICVEVDLGKGLLESIQLKHKQKN